MITDGNTRRVYLGCVFRGVTTPWLLQAEERLPILQHKKIKIKNRTHWSMWWPVVLLFAKFWVPFSKVAHFIGCPSQLWKLAVLSTFWSCRPQWHCATMFLFHQLPHFMCVCVCVLLYYNIFLARMFACAASGYDRVHASLTPIGCDCHGVTKSSLHGLMDWAPLK